MIKKYTFILTILLTFGFLVPVIAQPVIVEQKKEKTWDDLSRNEKIFAIGCCVAIGVAIMSLGAYLIIQMETKWAKRSLERMKKFTENTAANITNHAEALAELDELYLYSAH